ncbi:MAG: DUF3592 domain-containing protein [Cyclobacteriaceae bacterium]|nr:DUF3592 domain-containing protein [Cyclobacteriaceae bacterium]
MPEYVFWLIPFWAIGILPYAWSLPKLVASFRRSFWKVETTVISKHYDEDNLPHFTYTLAGEILSSTHLSDLFADGDQLTFTYPKGNPEKAELKNMGSDWGFPLAIFLFGCLWCGMLTWMTVDEIEAEQRREAKQSLKIIGEKLVLPTEQASVVEEQGDKDHAIYYRIKAFSKDTAKGDTSFFYSRFFTFDPYEELAKLTELTIYVSPSDKSFYLMEVPIQAPKIIVNQKATEEESVEKKGWILFLFGFVVLAGSGYFIYREYYLAKNGMKARARVLHHVSHYEERFGYRYHPFVQFSKPNGDHVRMELPEGSNPPAYQVGDLITVFYEMLPTGEISEISSLNVAITIMVFGFAFVGALLMMAGVYFFLL